MTLRAFWAHVTGERRELLERMERDTYHHLYAVDRRDVKASTINPPVRKAA